MNKTRNNSLRAWLTALCAAAFCLLGTQTAWGQTTQGVKVGDNVTKVNNVAVTSGEIKGANSGTTVTVTVASPSDGKVAVVTVSPTTIPATSVTALTPSATTVQKDNTFTVTATVSPAYADKLYWTVSDSEKAGFVSGSTTVSTLETTVDASTGTTTATLKALASGTVTVSVKAASTATELATTSEITINALPPGALPDKFTINAAGNKVLFAQGNLQYQASTDTWRFAEHQYDYVGNAAGNNTSSGRDTQSGWIDLFGWGTSGKTFASGYGTAYQPWATSQTNTDYGPTDGTSGLTGTYANGDWGVNMGTGWRTLTSDQWSYLFIDRTTGGTVFGTAQARYTEATINTDGTGVNGIILFPDGVDIASSEVTTAGTVNGGSAYATKCTTDQWVALESKGCVFLPAAGFRNGTSVGGVGTVGHYWSSTPASSSNAYTLIFYSGSMSPDWSNLRYSGRSVRLVQDVAP